MTAIRDGKRIISGLQTICDQNSILLLIDYSPILLWFITQSDSEVVYAYPGLDWYE